MMSNIHWVFWNYYHDGLDKCTNNSTNEHGNELTLAALHDKI